MDMAPPRPGSPRLRARVPVATATTEKDGERAASPFHTPWTAPNVMGRIQDAPSASARRQENAIIPLRGKIDSGPWNVEFRAAEPLEWWRFARDPQWGRPTRSEGWNGVCECCRPFNQARFCLCMKFIRQRAYPNPSLLRILNTLEHVGFVSRRLADADLRAI